jgi:predicted  nucleic acid-binding Zn-ribbon protein
MAYIIEFKVKKQREESLEETLRNAHAQIEEKQYEQELLSSGISSENIRKYGFAFEGKTVLIG